MKTYEQLMTEASLYGLGKSVLKRGVASKADDIKRSAAAQGRSKTGKVGEVANQASKVAKQAQDVKDTATGGKAAAKLGNKQLAKVAPKAAAKLSQAAKPLKAAANTVSKVAGKVTKPISKVVGGKVLGPAAVGVGIADATFRNPKVQKAYQNYTPPSLKASDHKQRTAQQARRPKKA